MSRMAIVHFVNYKRGTQSRAAMRGVMLYVMQEKKTAWEGAPLVSGINCQPQSVYDDFLNTKLLYHKDGGTMFYHMVQSFPKGAAVDPRQAHEAARRLAEYFDGCEVLVCTHIDREHIHSHCVINSVNFETGKKLHMAKEQLQELMRRNDAICQEMGLPVFDAPTQQARGMSGAEYHTALKGQSWKLRLMNTIDECMKYAADRDAFVSLMESEGYFHQSALFNYLLCAPCFFPIHEDLSCIKASVIRPRRKILSPDIMLLFGCSCHADPLQSTHIRPIKNSHSYIWGLPTRCC